MIKPNTFKILTKYEVAPETFYFEVEAPLVARSRRAGQFLIVMPTENSERIPLSIAGGNRALGTVHFAVARVGRTTDELCALNEGDSFYNVLGPLGEPTHIDKFDGTVLCVGGGYGAGAVVPIAEAARELGNKVIGIVGARDRERLIFCDEMEQTADEIRIVTEDGSVGTKGRVTDVIEQLRAEGETISHVYAIGPVPMMRAVAEQTRPLGIGCTVSLNAIMVDGTGMCGGCRVTVGGKSKFACFDGPDFDGHAVDFKMLIDRQKSYRDMESKAREWAEAARADSCANEDGPCCLDTLVSEYEAKWVPELPEGVELPLPEDMKPKVRMSIPRQKMPEQPPEERIHNFDEVAIGLTVDQAQVEAARCLQCKKPFCVDGCPVNIAIPEFLKLVAEGDFLAAARKVKESNCLPAVSGRVCPQENQCESVCVRAKKSESVAIGRLERFVADYERKNSDSMTQVELPVSSGKKVAVVGSGPAGLTVAGELARRGHKVIVFEALHRAGGVLIYGIPEFRLPNEIVETEVENLRKLGVEVVTGALIGRSLTIEQLMQEEDFDAVFLGTGAGLPRMMDVPGEDLKGVYTANEFLTRINLMRADRFPEEPTPVMVGRHVVVVGAGNTAMDCVRAARRMNAEKVTMVYRRTEAEMPARVEEVHHAREEGVDFMFLAGPVELHGDGEGFVQELECVKMELGEPDASGRRRPHPVEGSNFRIEAQTVVSALGFGVNPLVAQTTQGLELDRWGVIKVGEDRQTTIPGVFAGGDATTGGATVILAMGQGKQAAAAIHEYLTGESLEPVSAASSGEMN